MKQNERILRKSEVLAKVALSHPTIYRMERAGNFPRRLRLGGNSCGWLASEVEAWINERAAERTQTKS